MTITPQPAPETETEIETVAAAPAPKTKKRAAKAAPAPAPVAPTPAPLAMIALQAMPGASFISGWDYQAATGTMLIQIQAKVYAYQGVDARTVKMFLAAAKIAAAEIAGGVEKPSISAGVIYNDLIKPQPCIRLL